MVESDDEKEADVSKPATKRPLDHVPLKIIIKRKRPENEKSPIPPPPSKPSSEACIKLKKKKKLLQLLLLSKYTDKEELGRLIKGKKSRTLQEIWHNARHQQLEEETDSGTGTGSSVSRHYASGVCVFGAECEMPWLHPIVDVNLFSKHAASEDKSASENYQNPVSEKSNLKGSKEEDQDDGDIHFSDWRYGPAKFWYDSMNIPDNCKNFTYGFKLKLQRSNCERQTNIFPEDAFLMVSQLHWEKDVIWKVEDIPQEDLPKIQSKWVSVGGRGPSYDRSLLMPRTNIMPVVFQGSQVRNFYPQRTMFLKGPQYSQYPSTNEQNKVDKWKSILPFDNEDLTQSAWEKEIIWDAENMLLIPKPKIPILDPNDENIVLGVPEDLGFSPQEVFRRNRTCVKLSHPYIKSSKIVVEKTGVTVMKDDELPPNFCLGDPFNISNDSHYSIKSSESSLRLRPIGKNIQHSTPVLELRPPFIPTHLGPIRLRNFHRPPLKKFSHGLLAHLGPHPVYSLTQEINWKQQIREEERQASGGGDVFFMREPEDLSGRDGELVLIEFSEEYPLLMNEVGMCSKIINYYKRKASKDQEPPQLKYGELVFTHTSPFLGALSQGQCLQAVENNLFRSPIYEHQIQESDFLVIRTRHSFSIREANALYVAGQQCPLLEVPAPHSRCATNFSRDFLQFQILRMFKDCPDSPKWVRMDEIKRALPLANDLSIRKFLKICAEFKRVEGMDANCYVLKPDYRLPSEEELRDIVTPEQCCAQFSMMASEQRLKDAGYGGSVLFVPPLEDDEDESEEGMKLKIDDEIKAAPWNLTAAFLQSVNGKCLLQVNGPADPTGCGEGFSYIARSNRPGKQVVVQDTHVEKEKPTASSAKVLLKKMGVPDKEIKRLSSWELVDIARSFAKKKMRMKGKQGGRVPKVRPMTTAEHHAKYKEECQQVFDLQNQVLQSNEVLSTDEEEESDDDGSDVEEMGKILEKLISDGKSYSEMQQESEEKERQELVKMMMDDNAEKQSTSKDKIKRPARRLESQSGRVLKINRTFQDANGKEFTRVEFVRKSSVIDMYMKIRGTKDEAFIRQYVGDQQRILKEKRSIETQLLRIKQREHVLGSKQESTNISSVGGSTKTLQEVQSNDVRTSLKDYINVPKSNISSGRKGFNSRLDPKRRCGACGNPGHNRGNKVCPQYCSPLNVAMTQEEEEEYGRQLNVDDQNLVNVDGTKLKLSVKLIKRAEEMKRKTLVLRVPKDIVRKRKRPIVETHCDYLEKYQRPVNRRRVDPVIVLSNAFEAILNEMRDMPYSDPFHFPVNAKVVPLYYTVITHPMDLQTMRERVRQRKYHSRKDFLEDVHQIVQNSSIFNGPQSPFTINANKMLELCARRMGEQEEELMRLEETINPSDDEKDRTCVPHVTPETSGKDIGPNQTESKSIFDLTISESEDETEHESGLLDAMACPIVP